jgi:hypothetical protein
VTDYPDYQTPQAHATAIAATGVGVLRFANVLATATGGTLGGGGQAQPLTLAAYTQPSWELAINANLPAGAGTLPFVMLLLDWRDPTGNLVVARDVFIAAAGNGPSNLVITGGYGPAKSEVLNFQIFNLEPVQTLTYSYVFSQTSHVFEQTRWRQPNIPGTAPVSFTNPNGDPRRGIIANINAAVGASSFIDRLLPAYSGKWRGLLDNTAGTNACTLTFRDIYGLGLTVPTYLDNIQAAAGAVTRFEMSASFEPLIARIANNGTTGTITPNLSFVAEDY